MISFVSVTSRVVTGSIGDKNLLLKTKNDSGCPIFDCAFVTRKLRDDFQSQ